MSEARRRGARGATVSGLLVGLALVSAGCGADPKVTAGPGSATARPSVSPAAGSGSTGAGANESGPPASGRSAPADLSALDGYLSTRYPNDYGGLAATEDGITVYRRSNAALDGDVGQRFPGLHVTFVVAEHSRRQLRAVADRVRADMETWRSNGVEIMMISTPPDGSRIQIGTPDRQRDQGPLLARYGSDLVEVVAGQEAAPLSLN